MAQAREPESALIVRDMRENEWEFVLDSWKKSYASSAIAMRRGSRYWTQQENIARWCMQRGAVLVAEAESAPDVALGWICGTRHPACVDYVYVKQSARRLGVARGLVQALCGGDPRTWRPRMTHTTYRKPLRAKVLAAGWVFAPVTPEETGRG